MASNTGNNALAVYNPRLDAATAGKLTQCQRYRLRKMTTALFQGEYLLKVGMDKTSMLEAQIAIHELTKPETKVYIP